MNKTYYETMIERTENEIKELERQAIEIKRLRFIDSYYVVLDRIAILYFKLEGYEEKLKEDIISSEE